MEAAWNSILEFTSKFVIPDWESVIRMIPIALLIVIAIWLILTIRRFATAGPTRRGKARVTPIAPAGVHMPGGSWAPILAAVGTFLTFWGLVVGGPALWLGIAALVLTLLYWGREGLRDYDSIGGHGASTALVPAVEHSGPPPGVHMPGPSFRPILGALGVAVLFYGLVFGGWLLLVGVILTIATMLGWLIDARREYVHTVEADATGHLRPLPDPRWPRRLLWVGGVLIALALLADAGIFPPRTPEPTVAGGGAPGAPPSQPPASGETPGSPAASGPAPSLPEADAVITAQGVQFTTQQVETTGPDFTIAFDNRDNGVPHDVDLRDDGGTKVFDGDVFPGPEVRVYEVTGIQAGTYEFFCSVHPNMTGTITVN